MMPQTHGGWMPPHEPSASWRSLIQRSATRSARARSRAALAAWGVSLYLLGMTLVIQIGAIAGNW